MIEKNHKKKTKQNSFTGHGFFHSKTETKIVSKPVKHSPKKINVFLIPK